MGYQKVERMYLSTEWVLTAGFWCAALVIGEIGIAMAVDFNNRFQVAR